MQWLVFLPASIVLIAISWKSLRKPLSHGFYRFFAWECIFLLFVINAKYWFKNPFAWYQLIAWTLLFISLIPLGYGIHFLRTRGSPSTQRKGDDSLLAFEKTTNLVTTGMYEYIRHPLYSSLLFLAWGIFFKLPSLAGIALTATTTVFLFATARADEAECIQFFGDEYQEYMKHTKMFIPKVF
ncbi:MAG TPA: isoprenylcysteine carboxylmethyltransferase family protein [Anaerolineales bacterium]|nr:isoprenylcysteine carboxylmethyltransferase family protein [Anaerolineales bacterium]